jgi:hypothetical protein
MEATDQVMSLATTLSEDSLSNWDDAKRKDFADTFEKRVRAAQYILVTTGNTIFTRAKEMQFLSSKHQSEFPSYVVTASSLLDVRERLKNQNGYEVYQPSTVGGRPISELDAIAKARAEEILQNLPPLKTAVKILDPTIARMIEKRDNLLDLGKKIMTEAEEVTGPVDMEDYDQNATVGQFRAAMKAREVKRVRLLEKLDEIGNEGHALDKKINKFLYSGLPGLSKAVMAAVLDP